MSKSIAAAANTNTRRRTKCVLMSEVQHSAYHFGGEADSRARPALTSALQMRSTRRISSVVERSVPQKESAATRAAPELSRKCEAYWGVVVAELFLVFLVLVVAV